LGRGGENDIDDQLISLPQTNIPNEFVAIASGRRSMGGPPSPGQEPPPDHLLSASTVDRHRVRLVVSVEEASLPRAGSRILAFASVSRIVQSRGHRLGLDGPPSRTGQV